ncbi:MAG: CRISPR-associated endonuclease Cas1 [Veillonellaceae bacterium]|nr:CRISPR-associated endonuclease Cas1 [Veillonellaceae bacterium]
MGKYVYLTEDYAWLKKRGGRFVVEVDKTVKGELPIEDVDCIVLCGKIEVSSSVITYCLQRGITLTWLSSEGQFYGRLESTHNVRIVKQANQFSLSNELNFVGPLRATVVKTKIANQITLLRRYNRERKNEKVERAIEEIKKLSKKVNATIPVDTVRGYEGLAARLYFRALGEIVEPDFYFEKRTKQPPLDAFNSMLSFGYTLLMYDLYTAISIHGLHPYIGFMHKIKQGHPALASDLMEEWRAVIVDSMVMALVQGHEIGLDDFHTEEETGGVYLNTDMRKFFITQYEKRMNRFNQYGKKRRTFRDLLISQVESYAQAIQEGNPEAYTPIMVR